MDQVGLFLFFLLLILASDLAHFCLRIYRIAGRKWKLCAAQVLCIHSHVTILVSLIHWFLKIFIRSVLVWGKRTLASVAGGPSRPLLLVLVIENRIDQSVLNEHWRGCVIGIAPAAAVH